MNFSLLSLLKIHYLSPTLFSSLPFLPISSLLFQFLPYLTLIFPSLPFPSPTFSNRWTASPCWLPALTVDWHTHAFWKDTTTRLLHIFLVQWARTISLFSYIMIREIFWKFVVSMRIVARTYAYRHTRTDICVCTEGWFERDLIRWKRIRFCTIQPSLHETVKDKIMKYLQSHCWWTTHISIDILKPPCAACWLMESNL